MRPVFLGDERGAVGADRVIIASGLAILGGLCLYKAAGWADVVIDGVGSASTEYATQAPGVADVSEADFVLARQETAGN